MKDTTKRGRIAESACAEFLKENGYEILKRNFYFKKKGEIDIIATKEKEYIFVEVKARMSFDDLNIQKIIPLSKQKKILAVSQYFLESQAENPEFEARFDIMLYSYTRKEIQHISNAFSPFS